MTLLSRPETLTSVVEHHIRDAIIRGDYLPGAPLPEIKLAETLGTSRGTVREALRSLSSLGLVDFYPHRGCFVSQVTKARAEDIYELRLLLEPVAVRKASLASDFQERSLPRLVAFFERLGQAVDAGDAFEVVEAERNFHRETWAACPNEFLKEALLRLEEQTRRLLIYSGIYSGLKDEIVTHGPILQAMQESAADQAAEITKRHIEESRDRVLRKIPDDQDPPAKPT